MPASARWLLPGTACWAVLAAACGGRTAGIGSAPGTALDSGALADSGGTGESGRTATPSCGDLGCPLCDTDPYDPKRVGVLCATTQACDDDAQCGPPPAEQCAPGTTGTVDFYPAACLGGYCAYHRVTSGACGPPAMSCAYCAAEGKGGACAFYASAGACGLCCQDLYGARPQLTPLAACACGPAGPCSKACATSPLCGGAGPESGACVACVGRTLLSGGFCVSNATFQTSCIAPAGDCATLAQCLVGCPKS